MHRVLVGPDGWWVLVIDSYVPVCDGCQERSGKLGVLVNTQRVNVRDEIVEEDGVSGS